MITFCCVVANVNGPLPFYLTLLTSRSTLVLISNLVRISSTPSSPTSPTISSPIQRLSAIYAVWSILTSSNAILKQWIGIPASAALSSLSLSRVERGAGDAMTETAASKHGADGVELVTLSAEDKTLGLLLSASRLQATNVNWTFESVRATHGIGGYV